MSAETLTRPAGDFYDDIFRAIDLLPRGWRHAATTIVLYLDRLDREGALNPLITDQAIADALGFSERFVQKGLNALHRKLGQLGKAVIDRVPSHGRRIIRFLIDRIPASPTAPPQTPPKEFEKTSTDTRSSSSQEKDQKKTRNEPAPAELVDRACTLIPTATPANVAAAVAVYGVEWVGRALDEVERHNRKPGNLPVKRWGFVLAVLKNWTKEGGPPAAAKPPAPKAPPAPPAAPKLLTAEQVAELVEMACSPVRSIARCGRAALIQEAKTGLISPELLATIPAELLTPPARPEVPAAGSGS